jgi:RNA exonuclease NGL2
MPHHLFVEAKGHGKLHGLVVMYRSSRYRVRAKKTVFLDEEYLHDTKDSNPTSEGSTRDEDEERRRRAGTRHTKNIGLIVALEDLEKPDEGIVVSTAHLYVGLYDCLTSLTLNAQILAPEIRIRTG